jgi:hypothetical protein
MNGRSVSVPDKYHHNISCFELTEDRGNDKSGFSIGKTTSIVQKIGPSTKACNIMTVNTPEEMN